MATTGSRLGFKFLLGMLLGFSVIVAFSLYADFSKLVVHLRAFSYLSLLPVLVLTLSNYLLRFIRWHYLLHQAAVRIPVSQSILVFLSGFSMAITPGKLGEIIKSYLIKIAHGIPVSQTAPVIVAERVADLLALLLLSLIGMFTYSTGPKVRALLITCGVAVLLLTFTLASKQTMRLLTRMLKPYPWAQRTFSRLDVFLSQMNRILHPVPLFWNTAISASAWFCECLGFYLILRSISGTAVPLQLGVFIYSATTILGALSFLPGGLLVTEGSMTLLLVRTAEGLSKSGAVAATLIVRFCTLWFGVVIGLVSLFVFRFSTGKQLQLHSLSTQQPDPPP